MILPLPCGFPAIKKFQYTAAIDFLACHFRKEGAAAALAHQGVDVA